MKDVDYIRPSRFYSTQGYWSGSEHRHRQHYIALVPLSRYEDAKVPEKFGHWDWQERMTATIPRIQGTRKRRGANTNPAPLTSA